MSFYNFSSLLAVCANHLRTILADLYALLITPLNFVKAHQKLAAAGHYESPHHGDFPKIQILTIEGLLSGTERAKFPDMSFGDQTFKAAKAEKKSKKSDQTGLFE
jgi:hypothetical protein